MTCRALRTVRAVHVRGVIAFPRPSVSATAVRQTTLAWCLLTSLGSSALGQDRRLVARLDPATSDSVSRLADSLRAAGLPAEPLIAVALQGATRRASPDVILAAVRQYGAALATARNALGASARAEEIESGAGVIVAGVESRHLTDFRTARPSESLSLPLVVLADLVARGVPPDTAASALAGALRAGARDEELTELRRTVERDILAGAKPAAAMAVRLRNVPTMRAPPARRVPRLGRPRLP